MGKDGEVILDGGLPVGKVAKHCRARCSGSRVFMPLIRRDKYNKHGVIRSLMVKSGMQETRAP